LKSEDQMVVQMRPLEAAYRRNVAPIRPSRGLFPPGLFGSDPESFRGIFIEPPRRQGRQEDMEKIFNHRLRRFSQAKKWQILLK